MDVTLSVFKAGAGGYVGRGHVHPAVLEAAREAAAEARSSGAVHDAYVARCAGALALILAHPCPPGSPEVHALGRGALERAAAVALRLGQYGGGLGNGGLALSVTEVRFAERPGEAVLWFLSHGAGPGAWNLPLYRAFADPFNTPSLLTDEAMFAGFRFEVELPGGRGVFELPDHLHGLLRVLGSRGAVVRSVASRATGETGAVASGGADPVLLVRCEDGFPSVGECLEPFAFPHAVAGWGAGAWMGPLMPVSTTDDSATRLDGPPRAIGLGFQLSGGRLVGPRDLLGDRAFDGARREALRAAEYLRRHGPLAPVPGGAAAVRGG